MAVAVQERPRPGRRLVKRAIDWGAAGWTGIAGGTAFMAVEMLASAAEGRGFWSAPREIGELLFDGFASGMGLGFMLAVSLCAHLNLSLLYGRALAYAVSRAGKQRWLSTGLLFGVGLYVVNYYVIGSLIPSVAAARSASWLFCHLAFGAAAAGVYVRLDNPAEEV